MEQRWLNSSRQKQLKIYCPFNKSCLYLGGESPEKVLAERNYLRDRVNQLECAIDFGTEQVIELRKRIEELEDEKESVEKELARALQAPFRKYEKQESSEPPKKRGAPFGHVGHFREKPENIDKYVDVYLDSCPHCKGLNISPCNHTTTHVQEDIEDGRVKATCFIHFFYWCADCKRIVHGWGENEIPHSFIGPKARAEASFLRYEIKVSYDGVSSIFHHLSGLDIAPGSIVGFDNKVFQKGQTLYTGLKETLPKTPYIHADETGWKKDWLWVFTNPNIAFFHIDEHRSSAVVREHLGESYPGILITDFYSAYRNLVPAFAKQKCCTHLLRDVKELLEKGVPEKSDAEFFLNELKKILQDAISLHRHYPGLTSEQWHSGKKDIFRRFRKLYSNPLSHEETETIRKRLVAHKHELFTFLKYPETIEPTNNRAERALRNSVIFRRLIFGTRSEQGKKNVSVISTIIRTAKLKMLEPLEVIRKLLTSGATPELMEQFGIPSEMPSAP